jgi:hypothetical protein
MSPDGKRMHIRSTSSDCIDTSPLKIRGRKSLEPKEIANDRNKDEDEQTIAPAKVGGSVKSSSGKML